MKSQILSDKILFLPALDRSRVHVQQTSSSRSEKGKVEDRDVAKIGGTRREILNYKELEPLDKEQVLADLLIQTALRTMSERPHIESLDDTLLDSTKCDEGGSVPPTASRSSRDCYHHTMQFPHNTFESSPTQQYMFGKMQGSKWARQRSMISNALSSMPSKPPMITQQLPSPTENRDAHPEPLNTSYNSVHLNPAFDPSRLSVPISTVRCHDGIITQSQQKSFLQLPKKLRRSKQGHSNRGIVRPVSLLVESQQVTTIGSQATADEKRRAAPSHIDALYQHGASRPLTGPTVRPKSDSMSNDRYRPASPSPSGRPISAQRRSIQTVHEQTTVPTFNQNRPGVQSTSRAIGKNLLAAQAQSPFFAFTSWTYQQLPAPPAIKQPYLYRPDCRPTGIDDYKRSVYRKTIKAHASDIDASLSFTIWVYDRWLHRLLENGADPSFIKQVKDLFDLFKQRKLTHIDLQDRDFLTALANHAQALAKIIVKRPHAGHHLAEDAQLAIIENLRHLKSLLDKKLTMVSDDVYFDILHDTLEHVLKRGSLAHLIVTDEVLIELMNHPVEAFEIYRDPKSGRERIRLKPMHQTAAAVVSDEITADDFYRAIDHRTGTHVYRLKKDAARREGLLGMLEVNFEIETNKKTGEQLIHVDQRGQNNDCSMEVLVDPHTKKQTLVQKNEAKCIPRTIGSEITMEDFELVIDEHTGESVLRLKPEVAARKGLLDLAQTNFEVAFDPITGQMTIRMRDDRSNGLIHDRFEVATDAVTGKQTIRLRALENRPTKPRPMAKKHILNQDDFECLVESATAGEVMVLKREIAERKDLTDLIDVRFEMMTGDNGTQMIVLHGGATQGQAGNTAFVLAIDASGQTTIEVEQRSSALPEPRATQKSIDIHDFEEVVDPVTGERTLKLTAQAAARKGLGDLQDTVFEMYIDPSTGDERIRIKGGPQKGTLDDGREFTIQIDEETGHQEILFQPSDETTRLTVQPNDGERHMLTVPNAAMARHDEDDQSDEEDDLHQASIATAKMTGKNQTSSETALESSNTSGETKTGDLRAQDDAAKQLDASKNRQRKVINGKQKKPSTSRSLTELSQVAESEATESSKHLFNDDELESYQQGERELLELDAEQAEISDEEYQARRKKLFAERARILKAARDRKMARINRLAALQDEYKVDAQNIALLKEELAAQIRAEEELLLNLMNPAEREQRVRARNEDTARTRALTEQERRQREAQLQAALAETKRLALVRAGEIISRELQKRSENAMYAEFKDLMTAQQISRAFTYSYFSSLEQAFD